jgi:signal transduction histidine kinase
MAALPQVIFTTESHEVLHGSLLDCPAEFFAKGQITYYRRCALGWSICPLGYNTYAAVDTLGRRIVIPGILVPNDNRKRRRFPNYAMRFTKQQIESYLRPHLQRAEDIRTQRDSLFRNLTHDLRAISTEIYHEAINARDRARSRGLGDVAGAIDLVLSSQQMMSVRLDIIDYESGQSLGGKPGAVNVFKKVEKVYLCFQSRMRSKSISGSLTGTSFSTTLGPDILEIVPFVLIENAIKYSPRGQEIIVEVRDHNDKIVVSVNSWGPCIADNERQRIFDKGFRGGAAERFKQQGGAGIGLYAAATIAQQHFGGKLDVRQGSTRKNVDGLNYYETKFLIDLPIHERVLQSTPRSRITQRSRSFRRKHTRG